MNLKSKKTILFGIASVVIFFCNCQPKTDNANLSDQKIETKNQTAIRVSDTEYNAAESAIASDADGNIYIVFVEHNADKSADVYLQKFDKERKSNGGKIRINPEQGQAKAWFGDSPTIEIGGDKAVYIGWTAKIESKEKSAANILYLSVSRDGGRSFDAPVKVNDDSAPTSHGMHSLEISDGGKVFMAWLDERNVKSEVHGGMAHEETEPNSEVFFAVSNDGGKTFSKNLKLSSEVCPCCKTNLAVDGKGKIYASWRQVVGDNFRHIAVASSENNGESFSAPVIVSDDQWQINACPVSGAAMKVGKENNLQIVWFTGGKAGKPGLYFSESNDGGKTFAPRKAIFENLVSGTPNLIADMDGKLRAVWESDEKIYISDLQNGEKVIGDGTNPATVFANGKIYTAFVKKDDEKRGVWLAVGD